VTRVVQNNESLLTRDQQQRIAASFRLWMKALDMEPQLLIGRHKETGGLLVLPIWKTNATSDECREVLVRAIDYIDHS
jgi:hypothetical protein